MNVYRYNIYNECLEIPSPSATPLIFIFPRKSPYSSSRPRPIKIDLLKDRVDLTDNEKIIKYLLRKIEDNIETDFWKSILF